MACNRSARFIAKSLHHADDFGKSDSPLSHGSRMITLMTEHNAPRLGWTAVYVDDIAASLDLYTRAFGLTVAFEHPGGDYAEFATGSTALALIERSLAAASTGLPLEPGTHPSSNITFVVDDAQAAFDRATSSGARTINPPVTKPWGQTVSYVADLDGNLIELATAVASDG